MATAHTPPVSIALAGRIGAGVTGGIAGGLAFGILLQFTGMLPTIAGLAGSSSVAVGWGVHLAVAALIGAAFAVVVAGRGTGTAGLTGLGLIYGAIWWVLGGLIIMPLWLGASLFVLNAAAMWSLVGHLLYGLALGAVYALSQRRLHHG